MKSLKKISFKYHIRQITACFLSMWLLFGPSIAWADSTPLSDALPNGIISSSGVDAPVTSGTSMTINQTAAEAIINWNNFDIGDSASVQFTQPGAAAAVLNRIHDGDPTGIMGELIANGRVFIVNPAGIVFGSGASVNVAQLIASSLNIKDADFLAGNLIFDGANFDEFAPGYVATITGDGAIINNGTIGDIANLNGPIPSKVALLGNSILNTGTIVTQAGGIVVMAAGDRVVLGQPGSNIIVEMFSATGAAPGTGDVINSDTGRIESPGGDIVLAAGDMFALAGPTVRTVKVHLGSGQVVQDGDIDASAASGNGGTVSLTSADSTTLGPDSFTAANAGTGGDSGLVTVHSQGYVDVKEGAQIEATGGYAPQLVTNGSEPLYIVLDNSVEIIGETISFAGDIDATASDPAKKGKIYVEADNLTVVDELPAPPAPIDNLLTEEFIEDHSKDGVDVELVAAGAGGFVTVEGVEDAEIEGGAGDIVFSALYDSGGINFTPNGGGYLTTIHTTYGGNIFMTAGSGGIVAGDLVTDDTDDNNHVIETGRIRVATANGGNISVGTMVAEGSNVTEISAISTGNLTVNGGVLSLNGAVPQQYEKTVGFARICLVADGDIVVDTSASTWNSTYKQITVDAHGKLETIADIRICAGGDLTLILSDTPGAAISANAQSSQSSNLRQSAEAYVLLGAGHEQDDPATITLNDDTDPTNFDIAVDTKLSGSGSLHTDPQEPVGDWHEIIDVPASGGDGGYRHEVQLVIDPDVDTDYICADCPKPPSLTLTVIANDDWALKHMNNLVNILLNGENSILTNDQGQTLQIAGWSQPKDTGTGTPAGTLVLNADGTFSYTPDPGYVGTVEFNYVIIDTTSGAVDDATVTIDMTNALPYANNGSASGPINVQIGGTVVFGDNPDTQASGETDLPLAVKVETNPTYGTVSAFDPVTGSFTYTPAPGNTTGTDSFTYSVSDGQAGAAPQIGTVTITLNNQAPVATDNDYSNSHNLNLSVSAGAGAIDGTVPAGADYDPDNSNPGKVFDDTLAVTPYSGPTAQGGTVTLNADGSFTYTPSAGNATGSDSFSYMLNDAYGGTDTATVSINLTNQDPVATDNSYGTSHNIELTVNAADGAITGVVPAGADHDPDNAPNPNKVFDDTLTVTAFTGATAQGGTVTLNADGSFVYTPSAGNTTGGDSFSYTLNDGFGGTDTALVSINLTNQDPVATDNSYGSNHNLTLSVNAANGTITGTVPAGADYDPDNAANPDKVFDDTLTVTAFTGATAQGGTVTLNADGSFVYTPSAGNTTGGDSFSYTLNDGFGGTDTALVSINLTNQDPVATDNSYGSNHNLTLSVNAANGTITGTVPAGADYDPDNAADPDKVFDDTLTVTAFTGATAQGGTVTLNVDGSFTYTPSAGNSTTSDSFSYTLNDNYGGTDVATVTINLTNQDPVATDNSYGTSHNIELTVNAADGAITGVVPAGEDYDPDNSNPARLFDDTLTVTAFTGATAQGGTVTLNADGSFVYTPSAGNMTGGDSFSYTLSDNHGGTDTATVSINLTNQAPVATDNSYGSNHNLTLSVNAANGTITGTVPAGADYDPDNAANPDKVFDDTLTVTAFTGATAQGGTVTLNADGSFVYTPSAGNTTGGDSFSYTLNDGFGGTDTAVVSINLTNQYPVATDNSYGSNHNLTLSVNAANGTITGTVPAGADYDPDNATNPDKVFDDTLSVTAFSGPTAQGGTVALNADGSFGYTPSAGNVTGGDSFSYTLNDNYGGTATAVVSINLTNQDPVATDNSYGNSHNLTLSVNAANGTITGTVPAGADYDPDNAANPDKVFDDILAVTPVVEQPTANGGTVTLNSDGSFTYTPSQSNMTGTDSFVYTLNDNYSGSNTAVVTINLTNQLPIAQPDAYSTDQDVTLVVANPDDVITGVIPAINEDTDPDNQTPGRLFDDTLTAFLMSGGNTGPTTNGGTVTLNGDGTFTYTPPAGFSGTDTFLYYVNDGYGNSRSVEVKIDVIPGQIPPESSLPPAPLPVIEEPEIEGCPVLLDAVATELGATSGTIQISINRALATAPNIQPCDACARFLNFAGILRDPDGSRIAAMVQVFNEIAPADSPPSEEMFASIATVFSRQLENEEMPQYATAMEFLDAFVGYIAILDNELGSPVGDSTAFAMEKHGGTEINANPNITAYVQMRLANAGK